MSRFLKHPVLLGVACAVVSAISVLAQARPYKGAEIYSHESHVYGKYVMRMQVAKGSGVLSTFFLYKPGSQIEGNFWEEIDIEIFGQNNATQWESNIIWGSPQKQTYKRHTASQSLGDSYNTYTLEWTPNYVAWYVNDEEIRRIQGGESVNSLISPQTMRFNLWSAYAESWVGPFNPDMLPVHQFINYFEYHSYNGNTGDFEFEWRDDFDVFNEGRWGKAAWTFDDNRVDFVPSNVNVQDGTLILSITDENATGFNGTVPTDDPDPVDPNEANVIQAESFDQVGGEVVPADGVVGYIDTGDWMRYSNIEISEAGTYEVEFRIASAISSGAFSLEQNGSSLTAVNVPNTGGWSNYTSVTREVTLAAGTQDLTLHATSSGFNVDWFSLTLVDDGGSTPPPPPPTDQSVLIEAENYDLAGGEVVPAGGVVGSIDTGEWMKYVDVEIPASGVYQIKYRVASAINQAVITLDQDGTSLTSASVPNTGGWSNYTTLTDQVSLTSGTQNLAIYASTGGFNIDWFELTHLHE